MYSKAKSVNEDFKEPKVNEERILFHLPVTLSWISQLILCLVHHCRTSQKGVQKLLRDVFDHDMSYGSIHNIVSGAKVKAKAINENQDLKNIRLAAQDEMFHYNKPILTGVDIPSLS